VLSSLIVMLDAIMQYVIMLNVMVLSVGMLCVFMLNLTMLSFIMQNAYTVGFIKHIWRKVRKSTNTLVNFLLSIFYKQKSMLLDFKEQFFFKYITK
jgi:hypothetical protein